MPFAKLTEDAPPDTLLDDSRSSIIVVFTTWEATTAALRAAASLAGGWRSSITIFATQVVPWPADIHHTHIPVCFQEGRLRKIAALCEVDTAVNIYLCRDRVETLLSHIPPERIVVIGARRCLWRNPDLRLARALRLAGFDVIVTRER